MNKKRWLYYDNPFGFKMPDPPVVTKPLVKTWEDFPDDQKEVILNIKNIIQSYLGECKISIFGSRLKGYWTEESDYDFIVHVDNVSEEVKKNILSSIPIKVDIFFTTQKGDPIILLIP